MTLLRSFPAASNVAVIGANGGIGQALVELLAADPRVATVHALSRGTRRFEAPNVFGAFLDLEDEESIAQAAAASDDALDLVIVSTGMLWRGEERRPEKTMRELSRESLAELFAVNAIGPALVAKHFLPRLRKGSKTVFASLSARVGSIGDNRLGGWYSYRTSKAALNMLLKTLAIEHARGWPDSAVVGLHPGTVATALSRPYTSRTPPDRLFAPAIAARYLINVVDKVRPEDSGGVFAWDGARIEY